MMQAALASPPHVLGYIGFAVVPWKRGAGRAKQALMLAEARGRDLNYVELTTDPENFAPQRVIQACGAVSQGGGLWRIGGPTFPDRAARRQEARFQQQMISVVSGHVMVWCRDVPIC